MQPFTASYFQFHNSFCRVLCSSPMHLELVVKCGFSQCLASSHTCGKRFINKITGWSTVEIGLQGAIILWKMPTMVGFTSQRPSIIDSLILILCLYCKQWPASQLYTYTGAANSSFDLHTHLCSFMPVPSSYALRVFFPLFLLFYARKWISLPKNHPISMQSSTIRSHNH